MIARTAIPPSNIEVLSIVLARCLPADIKERVRYADDCAILPTDDHDLSHKWLGRLLYDGVKIAKSGATFVATGVSNYHKYRVTQDWSRREYHKARRSGNVVAATRCSACGGRGRRGKIVGHHDDYAKPLDVLWFCHPCHMRHHGKGGFPSDYKEACMKAWMSPREHASACVDLGLSLGACPRSRLPGWDDLWFVEFINLSGDKNRA